jgi:hypothetical protein
LKRDCFYIVCSINIYLDPNFRVTFRAGAHHAVLQRIVLEIRKSILTVSQMRYRDRNDRFVQRQSKNWPKPGPDMLQELLSNFKERPVIIPEHLHSKNRLLPIVFVVGLNRSAYSQGSKNRCRARGHQSIKTALSNKLVKPCSVGERNVCIGRSHMSRRWNAV